jgi:hypothetical protein
MRLSQLYWASRSLGRGFAHSHERRPQVVSYRRLSNYGVSNTGRDSDSSLYTMIQRR